MLALVMMAISLAILAKADTQSRRSQLLNKLSAGIVLAVYENYRN
jgi:hypothetical protein